MSDQAKVMKQIKTLLDIANRETTNENEASAALNRAQHLLAKHNLEMSDVLNEASYDDFIIAQTKPSDIATYMHRLGMAVGSLYFCKYYRSRRTFKSKKGNWYERELHCFAGRKHNAEVALMMFEYLRKTVTKLAKESAKKDNVKTGYWSYVTAFQVAASRRIENRAYDMIPKDDSKETESVQASDINLPALVGLYKKESAAVEEYLKSKVNLTAARTRSASYDRAGYMREHVAGGEVGLNQQIQSSK